MNLQNQKGFTIIEVILFLALSSSFMMIAFMGIRGKTANIQFTDSMRSLHGYLVSEQTKVFNGVNSSVTTPIACDGAKPGESTNCVLVGRVVTFGEDPPPNSDLSVVGVDVMYGEKHSEEYYEANSLTSDIAKIDASKPKSDGSVDTYTIEWGTGFKASKSKNGGTSGVEINKLGWLMSPDASRIIPIVFNTPSDVDGDHYKVSADGSHIADEINAKFCFESVDGNVASINFDDDSSIVLTFDDTDCEN